MSKLPFTQIPNWAIEQAERLSPNAWILYCLLCKSRNQKTGKCCPSYEALGWEKTKYYRAKKELELIGWAKFNSFQVTFLTPVTANSQNGELNSWQVGELENSQLGVGESATEKLENPQLPSYIEQYEVNKTNKSSLIFSPNDDAGGEIDWMADEYMPLRFVLITCRLWSEFNEPLVSNSKTWTEVHAAAKAIRKYIENPKYAELVPGDFQEFFEKERGKDYAILPGYITDQWSKFLDYAQTKGWVS